MNFRLSPYIPQKIKVPERLIYNSGDTYIMYSRKNNKVLGRMIAYEKNYTTIAKEDYEFYPNLENYTSLYILALWAKDKRQGVGKTFLNFAKHLADNPRCKKRITLLAMNNQDGNILNAPSPFYRKCGYTSAETEGLEDVDRVLRKQRPLHGEWYCCLPMYLPLPKN